MKLPFVHIATRIRDSFSNAVLGTTSRVTPGLSGGLSLARRAEITFGSLALATLLAVGARPLGGDMAIAFLYPALMVGGIFGGLELALFSLAIAFATSVILMPHGFGPLWFVFAGALQVGGALLLRELFRESRRWGVRYRALLKGISAGVIVSQGDGQILRPHPELEPLLNMKWPEYKGFGWIEGVHPEDLHVGAAEPGVRGNVLRRTVLMHDPETGDWRWYQFRSVPLMGENGKPKELVSVLIDVHNRKMGEQQRDIVTGEMRHRWKNLMTVITALAQSSQPEGDEAVAEYVDKFLSRMNAVQAAGDLAFKADGDMDVGSVIESTLAPFKQPDTPRFMFSGPRIRISETTVAALALGVHELATNAIKYGALSVPEGRVSVNWQVADAGRVEKVLIEWIERGGPPVSEPLEESFGARVIRFVPARERSGHVELDYRPEGLRCSISFLREKMRVEAEELAI